MPQLQRTRRRRTPPRGTARALAALTATLLLAAPLARAERPHVYAITGARVIVAPGQHLESATVVVRDGLIEAVGERVEAPADAELIDGDGLTVWAGWIDPYSHVGMKKPEGGDSGGFNVAALLQPRREKAGTGHPLELVHPHYRVTTELLPEDKEIERRRELGFTAALVVPRDGIFRGWSALVTLGDGAPRERVVVAAAAQHIGFDRGQFFGGYPADLLGSIATIRQVTLDAQRYVEWRRRYAAHPRGMRRPEYNDAFDALAGVMQQRTSLFIHAGDNRAIVRALHLSEEFGVAPVILGGGFEYEILDQLRDRDATLIVPVDYPDKPEVDEPARLPAVSLHSLQRWQRAPGNAAALAGAGVRFALTAYGLGNVTKFRDNVRRAIEAGLDAEAALAAVTTVPAEILGVSETMATVQPGKIANLVVATGDPFAEDTEIRHVFVDGVDYEVEARQKAGDPNAKVDPRGEWAVTVNVMGQSQEATWTIEGSEGSYTGRSVSAQGETEFDKVTLEGNALTVVISGPMGPVEATVVIEGDTLSGSATIETPGGQSITLSIRGERITGPQGGSR